MIDALAQTLAQAVGRLAVELLIGLLHDVAILAAAVWAILAAGRVPVIRRTPFLGRMLTDSERGARRLFVSPAQRAMRTGIAPRSLGWCILLAVIAVAAVPTLARVPAVLALTWAVGHAWSDRAPGWWSHRVLAGAMVTAGILRAPREGEPPPSLSYRGAVQHTEHGTTVVVGLPDGRSFSDVLSHREALAAALRVPTARLEVTQHEDDPANVIRVHVSNGATGETAAEVASAGTRNWSAPIRIGRDTRGEPVYLATNEHNTLVAGRPGSGKTSLSRIALGHYLLDPTTAVYLLDGKGSTEDYGACRPLCTRFVSGTDDDAVPDTLAMLGEVLDLVRTRNTTGGTHPGVLVLLEELQDVRAAATKPEREQLDALLGRIVRMGRAVAVHVLISTQRPTVDDLPAGTRNLISQRLALMLRNGADAALVLGTTPALSLPTRRGQALYTDGGPVRGVLLDRLTDDAWRSLCTRATALRPTTTAPVSLPPETPTPEAAPVDGAPVDPLLAAAVAVLRDSDPTGITATDLHAQLPEWTRPMCPTARALGVELARSGGMVERVNRGQTRVWRLTEQCRTTAGALPDDCRGTAGALPGECRTTAVPSDADSRNTDSHAHPAPADSHGTPTPTLPTPHTPARTPERTAP